MPSSIMIMMQSGSTKSSLLQRSRLSAPGFLVSWKFMKLPWKYHEMRSCMMTNIILMTIIIRPIIDFRHMHWRYVQSKIELNKTQLIAFKAFSDEKALQDNSIISSGAIKSALAGQNEHIIRTKRVNSNLSREVSPFTGFSHPSVEFRRNEKSCSKNV